jgi:hypothetical protein
VPGCATTVRRALNVFSRRDGQIRYAYCTELLLVAADPEHVAGYVDSIWPPWNLSDSRRKGGGDDWRPTLWPASASEVPFVQTRKISQLKRAASASAITACWG